MQKHRKRRISREDRKIYELSPVGRAYLEYNDAIGGEPFGFTIGMPAIDLDQWGGIEGMYRECIRRGITWQELTGWDGHSDELPPVGLKECLKDPQTRKYLFGGGIFKKALKRLKRQNTAF